MEINIQTVIDLYKDRLSNVENELIMSQAHTITLQLEVEKLKNLLKENNIEII